MSGCMYHVGLFDIFGIGHFVFYDAIAVKETKVDLGDKLDCSSICDCETLSQGGWTSVKNK